MATDFARAPEPFPAQLAPRIDSAPLPPSAPASRLPDAVQRHGRIVELMRHTNRVGDPYTAEQRSELFASRASLDAIRPHAAQDLESAMSNDHGLIGEAADGRTSRAIRAMQLEQEVRENPAVRADVFVKRWQSLERQRRLCLRDHETSRANRLGDRMIAMAKSLERDPQVESILRNRSAALGLPERTRGIGQGLADMIGRGRGRGLGIGM